MSTLDRIFRYPLKGFNGQPLNNVQLQVGKGLPFDRQFAISNGQHAVNKAGQWTECQAFVRLTKNADLSLYGVQFDETVMRLQVQSPTGERLVIELDQQDSVQAANATLALWFPGVGDDKATMAQAHAGYWDHVDAEIAVINLATVDALSHAAGHALDPLRFRGNLYVNGLAPQAELAWLGQRMRIGEAELEFIRPIDRCSATSLDPRTGQVDVNMPALLARHMGHIFCGMYARVVKTGRVHPGDALVMLGTSQAGVGHHVRPSTAPEPAEWPRFARVVQRVTEDQHVDSFWLDDPLANQRAPVLAGQHVRIHMQDGEHCFWRAYTVSAVQGNCVRISVKRAAQSQGGSAWLHAHLNEGNSVLMSGAFGEFIAPPAAQQPLVFISAGIGITPIVAMLKDLVEKKTNAVIQVMHACHSVSDLALWHEVQSWVAQLPKASAQLFLSQADDADASRLHASVGPMNFEGLASTGMRQTLVYMCGPSGFMTLAQDKLVAMGIFENNIHREVFASPLRNAGRANPAPEKGPFQIKFARRDITVNWQPELGSLLDLAELHGLKLSANCRSGACNTCRQAITQGEAFHTLVPAMPQPEQTCLMCCAVPVSDMVFEI